MFFEFRPDEFVAIDQKDRYVGKGRKRSLLQKEFPNCRVVTGTEMNLIQKNKLQKQEASLSQLL